MMLGLFFGVLLLAALTVAFLGDARPTLARSLTAAAFAVGLAVTAAVPTGETLVWDWAPSLGARLALAADGAGIALLAMGCAVGLLSVLAGLGEARDRDGAYHAALLFAATGALGTFVAADGLTFFAFFELMLLPGWVLVARWGSGDREDAGRRFFLFTQAGGLLLLLGLVGLGSEGFGWMELTPVGPFGAWALALVVAGLGVKLPIVPLHGWLGRTYASAPIGVTVLFAGLLSKAGGMGLYRVAPMLSVWPELQLAVGVLGVVGVLYGAFLAFSQTDLKRLVAFSSMSHLGYVAVGLAAPEATATQGAVVLMVAHGLTVSGFLLVVGWVAARAGTTDLYKLGGLWHETPRLAFAGIVFAMASLGLPGFLGFAGETITLIGVWAWQPGLAVAAQLGVIGATLYATWALHGAFLGPIRPGGYGEGEDLSVVQVAASGLLTVLLLVLGLKPQLLLSLLTTTWGA